jgi:hypothetical protein
LNHIQIVLISFHRSVLNCTRYLPFLTFHHQNFFLLLQWSCKSAQA